MEKQKAETNQTLRGAGTSKPYMLISGEQKLWLTSPLTGRAKFPQLNRLWRYHPLRCRTSRGKNRTTFIPKEGKDPSCVANWRPITIGQLLCRIYTTILDRILRRNTKFHSTQKGFVSENGTFVNTQMFQGLMKSLKTKGQGWSDDDRGHIESVRYCTTCGH